MQNDLPIDELLCRFFSGEATPEEAMFLEDWKARSTDNRIYFDDCAAIFAMPAEIYYEEHQFKAWQGITGSSKKQEKIKSTTLLKLWGGIAASVILLVATGFFLSKYFNKPTVPFTYISGTTSVDIQLKDASSITLAPNSSVNLDKEFGKSNRNITLAGSAYFSVKHDAAIPLIVQIGKLYIKDIGTKFSITTSQNTDSIFIVVQEGEVAIYDEYGSFANLVAGENASYIRSGKKLQANKKKAFISNPGRLPIQDTGFEEKERIDTGQATKDGKNRSRSSDRHLNGNVQDIVWLKKATLPVSGKIISIKDNIITLEINNKLISYHKKEILKIVFAPVADLFNGCPGRIDRSTTTTLFKNTTDTLKLNEGIVLFSCEHCGINCNNYMGAITVESDDATNNMILTEPIAYNSNSYAFFYTINLSAGNYRWQYNDNRRNNNSGKFTIRQGKQIKVTLDHSYK